MIYDLSSNYDKQNAITYVKKLLDDSKNKKVVIEITKKREQRTIRQNAYYHVVINLYCIHFGHSNLEGSNILKHYYGLVYEKEGITHCISSKKLDTKQMTLFIDYIRTHSAKQGCYIPTSEEYLIEQFRFNREIEQNKEFL